ARIVVKPIQDDKDELIETVLVALEPDPSLGPVARYTVGVPAKAAAIIVDPDQPRPASLRTVDGLFHLCLPADNGTGLRIETSEDLVTWTPVQTNVVTEGAIHYVDPLPSEHACRLYRARPETV